MSKSGRFKTALKLGRLGQKLVARGGEIRIKVGPLKGWNSVRVTPSLPKKSFRDQWGTIESEIRNGLQEMDPAMKQRMDAIVKARVNGGGYGHG
jgi:L-lactate dehydrogenase complex protein LldF